MAEIKKKNRSTAKGQLTKQSRQVLSYVHEKEEEEVQMRLDALKVGFVAFEQAHNEYITAAKDTASEENESYYDNVLSEYMSTLSVANAWLEGIQPVKTDNESNIALLVTLPKLEIDEFNGDPQMYLSFCAIFEETVDSVSDNDKIMLTRLLQFTTGGAHEAIRSCVLMGGNEGYAEARVILKKRFGANHLITERIIRDLTGGCFAKTPAQLLKLADAAANAERVLHSLNQLV